jgi:hypothetical protein
VIYLVAAAALAQPTRATTTLGRATAA